MKQDDYLSRERSISDYQKPVNNSRIRHHFKQKYLFTNCQVKSINKHIQNFAENHYFAQQIGAHSNVSGQQLTNSSQNNTKHTQNYCLSSFTQEGYFSDSQRLTPRMNFYLSSRTQQNEAQSSKDSEIQINQGSQSQVTTPRYYFNYKMLLQKNKILPNQFISKVGINSTAQESELNLKSKESEQNIKNKEIEQNFKTKNAQQIFKEAESFIYDEKQNSHHKDQKNSSFFINSQTVSDLILEDMTPSQFKISNAPSFLDQKQEAILNANNQFYPLIDNLQSDSFSLDEGCKQLTDSELILKNPNEFFQKVGIKPIHISQNKKKPLNLYLTEHVEKELAIMKQFDQSQIQDKNLNLNHFNNFFLQSKELIQKYQQQPYQDVDQLIYEKKQSNKLRLESPKCSQKNLNLIILKNKYNVVKQRIKIEKKDQTTSYLYENRDQLKLEYQEKEDQPSKKKKNIRDILLNNKDQGMFSPVDHFKKTLKLKQMLKFQDIVQQTFQNYRKNQVEINENQHQNNKIQKFNTLNLKNQMPNDQTTNKSQEKQPERTEDEKKQSFAKSSSTQISNIQQTPNHQNLLKQFNLNQELNQKDKQTNPLNQKSQENDDMQHHQTQQKIQNNQQIITSNQNQLKLNFWRVFSSKQLNQDGDKIQSNPPTQRSQTPKVNFKYQGDQANKNIKQQQNKILSLKKTFQQNQNQINKKNRIYSASPDSNQKITTFSFLKPQKQLNFSKDLASDRPESQYSQSQHKNTQIQKPNQNISSSEYLRMQNAKNENESFKEQEKISFFNKNKNQKLFEKLKQIQKKKQTIQKQDMEEKYLKKKQFANNVSEGNNGQQVAHSQNHFQKEQENQILNNSFVLSKQHVKNELNAVEKQIQNQRLLIDNIQQKKGEYLSPFREKPSNQFIYDHMFYQKHIQLLISVNKKYENLDL